MDYCIIISKKSNFASSIIASLKEGNKNYHFTDDGNLTTYVGYIIERYSGGKSFSISQPRLIERILKVLNLSDDMNPR